VRSSQLEVALRELEQAVGEQVEEMMRFLYQKSGNSRKFEYSNRIVKKSIDAVNKITTF
jgi:hypothetical protein